MARSTIFISYARAEPQWAERLERDLVARGYPVWRDTRGLPDGHDFTAEIEQAIRASSHVLVCLTPSISSHATSFVRREVQYALLLGDPSFRGSAAAPIVIPIIFPHGQPLVHVATLPFVVIANPQDYGRGLEDLVHRLERSTATGSVPSPSANARTAYLRDLYDWCSRTLASTVAVPIDVLAREATGAVDARHAAFVPRFAISGAFSPTDAATPAAAPRETSLAGEFEARGSVLVVGAPAAGKTTALLALARSLSAAALESADAAMPCVATISTWDGRTRVVEWLEKQTPTAIHGMTTILLLDGLDELGGPRPEDPDQRDSPLFDPRTRFLDWLDEELPDARIVVTTRKSDYEEMSRRARLTVAIELLPLGEAQIRGYVEGCGKPWLAKVIDSDPELADLVRSPLLLAMLTEAIETPSDFEHGWSRNRVITAWFTRVLKHEVSRGSNLPAGSDSVGVLAQTTEELELHAMRRILEPLADGLWVDLPREAAPDALARAERIRLLRRSRDGTLEFAHLLLLDHFAMPALAKFCAALPEDDSWAAASAIVDSVGGSRAAEFVIDFAGRATNESVKMLATATAHVDTPAYVPALLAFDHHNTAATDVVAGASFARLGPRAFEPLRARLLGPDEHLRERAAARLARIDPQGVDALIAAASDSRAPVRRAALTGLIGIPGAKSAACARPHVADPVADVRAAALRVIAASAPGSLDDHVLPLLDDPDPGVRRAALATLGSTCSPSVEAALSNTLDSEDDEGVRAAIAAALARCGSIQRVLAALRRADVSELVAAAVRDHAALLPTESLASVIRDHPNARIREHLCYALTGRADAAVALADLVRHDHGTYVRVAAARALTAIGKGDVVLDALGDALLDGGVLALWAAAGLAEIGSDRAATALWRGVENYSGRARDRRLERSIEQALDRIGTQLSRDMRSRLPWKAEE